MPHLPFIHYAQQCEDAAAGLHRLSDGLSRSTPRIATIVNEFFAISAVLRGIHGHGVNQHYGLSSRRIHDDLNHAFRSLGLTLDDIFDLFVKVKNRPEHTVWIEFNSLLMMEGSVPLATRMKIYHTFFDTHLEILERQETPDLEPLRQSLSMLIEAQEQARRPAEPSTYDMNSDEWHTEYLDRSHYPAPEPPLPLSSTYTSGSSQTLESSHTSYSGGMYFSPSSLVPPHWSLRVFDGRHPTTVYRAAFRSNERSCCYGDQDPEALQHLVHDGFLPALQVAFEEGTLIVRFYCRPSDSRARILLVVKDPSGYLLYYCQPLTNLKMIRNKSCLQLCRARRDDGQYTMWARLNFLFHERMVLFYSTFTAMKRQDCNGVLHPQLTDRFELETDDGEECQFSGQIKHDGMLHAIRVFRDRGSGVVRLEAAAFRGSKKDVALWTAFITKYVNDPDWAALERGAVNLAAFRPPPYVFIAQYEPPHDGQGNYVLPFSTNNDAVMFTQTWAQICSSYGRLV